MDLRRCRLCLRPFEPSRLHPEQTVCSDELCQRQRRSQNRKQMLVLDAEYRETCRDSARKWRATHWKQYRAANPESAERNRVRQNHRDLRQRLAGLANNHLASTQVFILQRPFRQPPLREASCKQHPSGVTASLA